VGRNFLILPGEAFTDSQTYFFEVEYIDVGGTVQAYELEVVWPPVAP
jgi:hypothetical protein